MNPGQKMYDENGVQVCLFPLPELIVNQWSGPNTYSHCCTKACDYGTHGAVVPVYAPFDCHLVYNSGSTAHTLFYCSDTPVRTPSGVHWVTIQLTHAQNPPYLQNVKQGQVIYYSGNAGGYSLGVHLHMEQNFIKNSTWVNFHVICTAKNTCYGLPDSQYPNDVFYVNDTTLTDTGGHTWHIFTPSPTPPEPPEPPGPDPDPPAPPDPGPGPSGGQFKWYLAKQLFDRRNNM